MAELFETRYFNGQGALFMGFRDETVSPAIPTGLDFVGDIVSAEMTPQMERVEVIENVTGQAGVGAAWNTARKYQLTIVFRSLKPEHLARIAHGEVTVNAGGSVTGETHTAYQGKFVFLAHQNISAVTVTGATVTTDYIIHADKGALEIVTGGGIADEEVITVAYTYAAEKTVKISPHNQNFWFVFSGLNRADDDKRVRCTIYKCKLDPGTMGFIQTNQEGQMSVTGTVLLDSSRPAGDQFFSWVIAD